MRWIDWNGRRIFMRTRSGKVFSGTVKDVDDNFLSIVDKFGGDVTVAISDIIEIKGEGDR